WGDGGSVLPDGAGGRAGALRRTAHRDRPLHAPRRADPRARDGGRVLHGPPFPGRVPDREHGRTGPALRADLPLPLRTRRRPGESGRTTRPTRFVAAAPSPPPTP